MMKKSLIIIFLLFSSNIFSQSILYEMLIDKHDTEKCSYEFINSKMKIIVFSENLEAPKGAVGIFEYNPSDNSFSKVNAFFAITEKYLFEKDGNNWLVLINNWNEKYSLKWHPKTKKAEFSNLYFPQCPQKFTFISNGLDKDGNIDRTLINNKVSQIRKKFIDEQRKKEEERLRKIDVEIGIELDKLVLQNKIKDLSTFRKKINNDVTSEDLKENYLDKINTEIKIHNDKLESEFSKAILDKDPDKVEIVFNDFVEYLDIEDLRNEIIETFNLNNKVLSITSSDSFKEYFIDFALINFPYFSVYNENAIIKFELTNGKLKSSTGHVLDYTFSDEEKRILKPYTLSDLSPKFETFIIKKTVELVPINRIFIHGKKDDRKLFFDENILKSKEERSFSDGGSNLKLFFSKKSFNNSKPIKTKSFNSLKQQIKINLNITYGFKKLVTRKAFGNLNSLYRASFNGKPVDGFFSKEGNLVNVYSQWRYELFINDEKITKNVRAWFDNKSSFSDITDISFNKPFYTVDVYQVY